MVAWTLMRWFIPDPVGIYLASLTRVGDDLLELVRRRSVEDAIPAVLPETGALLHVLASMTGASRILEIGTGYGYSAIWLGRALSPAGQLISMERDASRAAVARTFFARAGLSECVSVIVGEAERFLAKVAGPFDVIFQDADKSLYGTAHDRLVQLLRPGGALMTDNVLWGGDVVPGLSGTAGHPPDTVAEVASYNERLSADTRLRTVFLPVGDGVAVSVKRDARP
jgi:predicted O-methyltransferase YrrM